MGFTLPVRAPRHLLAGTVLFALGLTASCGSSTDRPGPAVAQGRDAPADGRNGTVPSGASAASTGLRLLRGGDVEGAEPYLVAALAESPRDRRILEALGMIYARSDRFQGAEKSFRSALAIDPASIGARLGLASVLIDTGRYEEAIAALQEVRSRDPGNTSALLKDALLKTRLGRADEAEKEARQVIVREAGNAEAHYVLGLALRQRGSLPEAYTAMRRAEELARGHLGALSHLASIATRLGRSDEAARWRTAYQESLRRQRVEERVRSSRLKGVEAFNREDYRAALDAFLEVAREDPDDPQVHLHLGSTYLALGDLESALRALERSLTLDPKGDRALTQLGRLHALANRLDEARDSLQKAIAVNPDFPEPHYYLAGVYMALGDADRYRQEMKRFEDLQARSQGGAMDLVPAGGGPGS
jgi:tetratricopeptide (TPR) repeat protein